MSRPPFPASQPASHIKHDSASGLQRIRQRQTRSLLCWRSKTMKVFVSYAHEDLDRVRELVDILIAGGNVVLFDDQLLPGQDWKHELDLLISDCDTFSYALTGAAIS